MQKKWAQVESSWPFLPWFEIKIEIFFKLSLVRHAKLSITTVNNLESGPRPTSSKCSNKFPWIPSCNRLIPKFG